MMRTWVPLPTVWIEQQGLKQFAWSDGGGGSDQASALICLMLIAHHTDGFGLARLTYGKIGDIAGLSRSKISGGLEVLAERGLIIKEQERSVVRLSNLNTAVGGWGMLPAKGLYSTTGRIPFFRRLHLRHRAELDALKLYLLFVARRDITRNVVDLSYDKIREYAGISRKKIPDALSLLSVNGLIRHERQPSDINDYATMNSYRLSYLDSYRHPGTTGRAQLVAAKEL
ncbi:hypothetical protein [Rhizobium oryzicola]|uniref:Helix-turn-helix domain-containing protein n=1 Tax=Rhizobium oryzicola TaxID=1232668 RepID=A0ABT8T4B9_9HYPH|nr:hypothetical protein [Rhizobium oryzicola]MDO1585507.1 hypothetical protein [Rhizobium oryzicola]